MNHITFADQVLFNMAVTSLEMESTPRYDLDTDTLTIYSDDIDYIMDTMNIHGINDFNIHRESDVEPKEDNFRNDVEADADALRSAGFGTDDDYEHCSYDEGDY